jgi:hypothetical protein
MMSDSKKMDGYPDRSKSFICTTSAYTAYTYGDISGVYVMIPLGSAKIALSSVNDIFNVELEAGTFYRGSPHSQSMYRLSKFFKSLGAKRSGIRWISSDSIKTALMGRSQERLLLHWALFVSKNPNELKFKDKELQDKWESFRITGIPERIPSLIKQDLNEMEKEMKEGRFTVEGKLAAAYEFIRQNSHDLYTALATELMDPVKMGLKLIDYGQAVPYDKECWFSGKCIAISFPVFAKILVQLDEQGFPIHDSVKRTWDINTKQHEEK